MSSSAAHRLPSYADIEALPPHLRGEILGGELVVQPRPGRPHTRAASSLTRGLGAFDMDDGGGNGPGGWIIEVEPELHLDVDPEFPVVIPDLAAWRVGRLAADSEDAAYDVAPDWVCEILSPRTAADDRHLKMPFYARAGVAHLWLIDPLLFLLEAYRNEPGGWRLLGTWFGAERARVEPFDALELALTRLWGGRKPPPRTLP